ncbi:MAG: phosphoribosylformylglycinamidine synthase subunit PurS [Verrucomicrobiae bacterium]|nr:phosphoribosylformylglycinamidine synthase subunit PurS [Verrucomicrobiae bacterium]
MRARVTIMPKRNVLDPQGKAVVRAIHQIGMEIVHDARVGKIVEIEIAGNDAESVRPKLEEICRDLLSNPVIEDYRLEFEK